MLNPQAVLNDAIPTVDPTDLQRLWAVEARVPADSAISFTSEAIAEICGSGSSDPIAVWARTGLIRILLQVGELSIWVENDSLHQSVFEAAARFPLPRGLQGFDRREFFATLAR